MHFPFSAIAEKWREGDLHFTCLGCFNATPFFRALFLSGLFFPLFFSLTTWSKDSELAKTHRTRNREQGAANKGNNSKANKSG